MTSRRPRALPKSTRLALSAAGRRGGLASTKAKIRAAKANGKLGGRPRKEPKP